MSQDILSAVQQVITQAGESHSSAVYRDFWGDERSFGRLPVMSRGILFGCPVSERRYKTSRSLVKIVKNEKTTFLSEWAYEDVVREEYGAPTKRPMVYLSDNAESIEKSMWCYERGMVPLIGEVHNEAVAIAMAGKYHIDSLITDETSLGRLRPFFDETPPYLESVSLLGTHFNAGSLMWLAQYARRIRLVLSLPETGVFAEAECAPEPVFRPFPNCIIEDDTTLIVTKIESLITPIIRYDTRIPVGDFRLQRV